MQNKKQEKHDLEKAGSPAKTAKLIVNKAERADAPIPAPTHVEDKRNEARQIHSHHFSSRATPKGQ